MAKIHLTRGKIVYIDDADMPLILGRNWNVFRGGAGGSFYARTWIHDLTSGRRRQVQMHRLLLAGISRVDHKDGDGLNNRRSNLRPATSAQNQANQRSMRGSSSRFKGVHWDTTKGKWRARIQVDGQDRHLGIFVSEVEAAKAYNQAAAAAWGEFARLNKIRV